MVIAVVVIYFVYNGWISVIYVIFGNSDNIGGRVN